MANETLIEYIKNTRELGYNDDQIRTKLLNSGWKREDIDEAISTKEISLNPIDTTSFEKPEKPEFEKQNTNNSSSFIENNNESMKEPKPILEDSFTNPDVPDLNKPEIVEERPVKKKMSVLAIIALILAFLIPPIGFILGIIAIFVVSKNKKRGIGLAIAAVILSVIFTLIYVLVLPLMFMSLMFNNIDLDNLNTVLENSDFICSSQVNVDVLKVGEDSRICISNEKLALQLNNFGMVDIEKWEINLTTTNDIIKVESLDKVETGQAALVKFVLDNVNKEESLTLALMPSIKRGNQEELISCNLPNLKFEKNEIELFTDCETVVWDD